MLSFILGFIFGAIVMDYAYFKKIHKGNFFDYLKIAKKVVLREKK
jgi:hypothetical protein